MTDGRLLLNSFVLCPMEDYCSIAPNYVRWKLLRIVTDGRLLLNSFVLCPMEDYCSIASYYVRWKTIAQ